MKYKKEECQMDSTCLDRTQEVTTCCNEVPINPIDLCIYYEKHPFTFLSKKECWTCRYSDFDTDTGDSSESGVCKYYSKCAKFTSVVS